MYYIVKKCTGPDTFIELGYLDSESDITTFYSLYGTPFVDWVESNPTEDKSIWFTTNEYFYGIDTHFELPEGLSLITDLNNLEGE